MMCLQAMWLVCVRLYLATAEEAKNVFLLKTVLSECT